MASFNAGKIQVLKTLLQCQNEWLTFDWCAAHRLQLAFRDFLSESVFGNIEELILQMHNLYKKLLKKLRQLKEFCDLYEKSMFVEGGYRPK